MGEQVISKSKKPQSYKGLFVWQEGVLLAKKVYLLTQAFPDAEKFGLISQMRRAAVSVPSNIAEGQARHTRKEFIQFLSHAEGSLAELETQVILSVELRFCELKDTQEITKKCSIHFEENLKQVNNWPIAGLPLATNRLPQRI